MLVRLVHSILWLSIMGLITFSAGTAILLGTRSLVDMSAGQFGSGSASLGGCILLAVAAWLLARYSDDLIDR